MPNALDTKPHFNGSKANKLKRCDLKNGTLLFDYEHIPFAGPTLWKHLFLLYRVFFQACSVLENLKTGVILPLFKGKAAKANNRDNHRGITLFPML